MTLEIRLNILLTGQVIDQSTHDTMLKTIDFFQQQYAIILTEENAQMYITHIAKALMRVQQGELISPVDPEGYEEFVSSEYFEKAEQILRDLEAEFNFNLPKEEQQFIIMNHCLILEQTT